jgi:YHS domain-containing protein
MKSLFIAALALCFGTAVLAQSSPAKAPPVALKGTDPVSYFNPGKPAKGASSIAYDFDDARYLFSNAKNKELFVANPDRYSPQFTGLCATGMGMDGGKYEADPNVFLVREGKLYVFSSAQARDAVVKDPSLLAKAHGNYGKKK